MKQCRLLNIEYSLFYESNNNLDQQWAISSPQGNYDLMDINYCKFTNLIYTNE